MSTNVALVTWEGLPALYPDDRLLVEALRRGGGRPVPAVWSDPSVDWDRFDLVLVRSTWDYHRRIAEFLRWVDRIAPAGTLRNVPSTIRWNSHKTYLADLERRGIPTVPTEWGSKVGSLAQVLRERRWPRFVLKPAVSANAENTHVLDAADPAGPGLLRELLRRGEVLIQPYLASVEFPGERSLVFFDGRFSHSVLRVPRLATVRSIRDGTPVLPFPEELDLGRRTLAEVAPRPLYARVDVAAGLDGTPVVMELELIEPLLYLGSARGAAEAFAGHVRDLER